MKIITILFCLFFTVTSQAGMLYQLTFSGENPLVNSGSQGGNATVIEFAGKGVNFIDDAPVDGKNSCDFVLQKNRQRSAKMELPGSEKILRCNKAGDKITFMTWVKWRGFNRESGIVATCTNDQKTGWGLRIKPEGVLSFAAFGGFGHRSSKVKVEKDTWTHVAFTWNVGDKYGLKMYINGQDAGINLNYIGEGPVPTNSNAIRIGVQTPKFYLPLNGQIYDLRIYDEILAPEQISAIASENQ